MGHATKLLEQNVFCKQEEDMIKCRAKNNLIFFSGRPIRLVPNPMVVAGKRIMARA